MSKIYKAVAKSPCKRFWISEKRALEVITSMLKGDTISYMSVNKQLMFYEIFRRVVRRMGEGDLKTIVEDVVQSPAPCFFMTPGTVKVLIHKHRKRCRK